MDLHAVIIRKLVYPLMKIVKDNHIMQYLHELRTNDRLTASEMINLQRHKLEKLLIHSLNHVPAYQTYQDLLQKNLPPDDLLQHIPICKKTELRNHGEQYISALANKNRLIPNKTGGSTGQPTQFYMDRQTVEYYEAARWRALSWWGIKPGDKAVMILGNPAEYNHQQLKKHFRRERLLKNRIVLPGYDLKKEQISSYIKIIEKEQPVYIYGYVTAIYMLAKYLEEEQIPFTWPLKGVITTAETLYPYQRQQIEKVFHAPVINEYGAKDGGIIAYQCPEGKMHITAENLFIEIVDTITKKPLPHGELGEILITDLNNFSMPRLRYEIGDFAALSDETCKCGSPLPILKHLEGRTDDLLLLKDGNVVPGHYFAHIAGHIQGFDRYQIIQHSLNEMTVKIVKNERFTQQEVDYLVDAIKEKMGNIQLHVKYVQVIPPTKSGKHRLVIREFPL